MATDSLNIDELVGSILTIAWLSHGKILAVRQQTGSPRCAQSLPCLIGSRVNISPDPGIGIGVAAQFRVAV